VRAAASRRAPYIDSPSGSDSTSAICCSLQDIMEAERLKTFDQQVRKTSKGSESRQCHAAAVGPGHHERCPSWQAAPRSQCCRAANSFKNSTCAHTRGIALPDGFSGSSPSLGIGGVSQISSGLGQPAVIRVIISRYGRGSRSG